MNESGVARIPCPVCGQGWVVHRKIMATGAKVYVCDECETLWDAKQNIEGGFEIGNYVDYMQARGMKGLWSEAVDVLESDS